MPKKHPIETLPNGQRNWFSQQGDQYLVICRDWDGRVIGRIVTSSWQHAQCVNLKAGARYLLRDGHRYLIEKVVG